MANSCENFSQVISEEVTCPVCLEELKEPKILNCSHNVCRECLERMSRNKNGDIVCPTCRKPTPIRKGGVGYLPTNAVIARIVEATLARKAKIEMKKSLAEGKPMVELLAKKLSDFDKALKVLNEIHEKADLLVDVIRNQEAGLCREVEQFYGVKCETINVKKNDLGKLHSSASRSVQDAETILGQSLSDPTKTINVAKTLKKQIEEIQWISLDLSQDTSTHVNLEFQFNAELNINSIFEDETFGKLTEKVLDTVFRVDNLPRQPTFVQRDKRTSVRDYRNGKEISLPCHWDPQPMGRSGREATAHLVDLDRRNHVLEYREVSDLVKKTLPAQNKIKKIQRVQNPSQYKIYAVRKQRMDEEKTAGSNEMLLFHGTHPENCSNINVTGFNRSYTGGNASLYGRGVYFAVNAEFCARSTHSPPDRQGNRYMYLARLLVGDYTNGYEYMITNPPKNPANPVDTYDTVVDDASNPTIFVAFYDWQSYPEYLITFQ